MLDKLQEAISAGDLANAANIERLKVTLHEIRTWRAAGTRRSLQLPEMWLAVPGNLATATGGYAYARRLIEALPATGWRPQLVSLPDGFPFPLPHDLETARRVLSAVPAGAPVIVDGLAYGAMPRALLDALACQPIPLVHHVLAMETGLSEGAARRLRESEREALGAATLVIVRAGTPPMSWPTAMACREKTSVLRLRASMTHRARREPVNRRDF